MKTLNLVLAIAASVALSPAAFAQAADTAPAAQPAAAATPAPAAQPAAPAAPAATAAVSYSDEDIQKYAVALLAVNKIQADASVADADKPAKYGEAVAAAGIDPAKFNEITTAMGTTPDLNQRVQAAAAKLQTPEATGAK